MGAQRAIDAEHPNEDALASGVPIEPKGVLSGVQGQQLDRAPLAAGLLEARRVQHIRPTDGRDVATTATQRDRNGCYETPHRSQDSARTSKAAVRSRDMSDGRGKYPHVPYRPQRIPADETLQRGRDFFERMDSRRSVRHFSDAPVPREAIELAIRTASTAPSGAHRQPWRFVVVDDRALKSKIREAAEAEEKISYEGGRMPPDWLEALAPLGTSWEKPYLETVPYIVVLFEEIHSFHEDGRKRKNYYVRESVGIAAGMFITALHNMGIATLTHTPSPMGFLTDLLKRPKNERPFVLFPVGYPADDAQVPDIARKPLEQIVAWNDGSE